jgi:RNA polymerase sigma-70 factor (ECF subfamily)
LVTADDDDSDVSLVIAGDLSAFERIVGRWRGPLINLAYRFCRDQSRAEDLAQEAFIRAFGGLSRWHRRSKFSTWLLALAMNVYRSELRRTPPLMVSLDGLAELLDPKDFSEEVAEAATRRAIRRAVLTLPPKYREALILYYFHEMDVSTAARTLGLPEGTLKARLARGRDMLRSKIPALVDGPHVTRCSDER